MKNYLLLMSLLFLSQGMLAQDQLSFVNVAKAHLDTLDIRVFQEDREGNIWIGTRGQGIFKMKGDRVQKIQMENGEGLNGCITILEDQEGHLWFGGLGVMKVAQNQFWMFKEKEPIKNRVVFSISQDAAQTLYLSGNRGLDYLQKGTWSYLGVAEGLRHQVVHDTYCDEGGNTWLATRKGGLHQKGKTGDWSYHLSELNCRKLLPAAEGDLWIGTATGLARYDAQQKTFEVYKKELALIPQLATANKGLLCSNERGGLFLFQNGTWKNYRADNSPLRSDAIHAVFQDSHGQVWIGFDRGYQRFDQLNTLLMKNQSLFINYLTLAPKYQELHNWTPETHQIIKQHSDYLEALGDEGVLIFAGRTQVNPGDENLFGIALIQAASLEEAQQVFGKDPAIVHQVQKALVLPFSMGIRYLDNIPELSN